MLRTALLFVRSAVQLVYAEFPGAVTVGLPRQALCELGDRVLGHALVAARQLATVYDPHTPEFDDQIMPVLEKISTYEDAFPRAAHLTSGCAPINPSYGTEPALSDRCRPTNAAGPV